MFFRGGMDMGSIECDLPPGAPAPIRWTSWDSIGEPGYDDPIAPSLGALVKHWIAMHDANTYTFDREHGDWQQRATDAWETAAKPRHPNGASPPQPPRAQRR
jgi:hypothetical protein